MTTFEHTFTWPDSSALKVFATGTFDSWKSTLKLEKGADGIFTAKHQLPVGKKTLYKYVVDGQWVLSQAEPTMADHSGNVNNFVQAPEVVDTATEVAPVAAVDEDAEKPVVELFESNGHLAAIASGIIGAAGIAAAALISVDPSTFTSSSPPVSPLKSAGESLPLVADTTADSTAAPIVAADVPKVEEVKSAVESTPAPVVAEDKAVVAEESKLSEVPVIGAAVVGATAVLGGAAVMGQKALASVGSGEKAATTLDESAKVGATKVQDTIPASASGGFGSSTAKALGLEKEFAATATPAPTIANPTIATAVTPVGQEHLKPIVPLLPLNENLVNNASETQAIPTPVVPALESNLPATVVAPTPVVAAVTPTPTPAAASAAVVDAPVSNDAAPAIPVKDGLPPVAAAVAAPASTPVKETLGKKAGKALKDAEANGDASSTRTKKSSFMSKMKRAFGGGKKDKKQPPMPVAAAPAATTAAQDVQSDDR